MIEDLKTLFQIWYDDFMWRNGEERKLLASGRLAAHAEAMKEGRNSPYTHPEEYSAFY